MAPLPPWEANTSISPGRGSCEGGVLLLRLPGCRGGGSGSGAKTRIWRPGKGSVTGARSQGQKVRSTQSGEREDAGGGGGGVVCSHSVTSSPSLRRARTQRVFFDGSQHTPLLPGPSAQRFRAGLLGRGRSDRRCVQARLTARPHPSVCLPLPTTCRSSKLLCRTFLLYISLYAY